MKSKLQPKQRLEMLKRVERGEPVSKVCRDFGISRVIFYRLKNRCDGCDGFEGYSERKKLEVLKDGRRGAKRQPKQPRQEQEKAILEIVLEDPKLSSSKISQRLGKDSNGKPFLGPHGVYNVLLRKNLNTYKKRLEFKDTKGRIMPPLKRKGRLTTQGRLYIVEKVLKDKKPVKEICRDHHCSPPTFYRWKKRYLQDGLDGKPDGIKLKALSSKKPSWLRHPRRAPKEKEDEVLKIVRKKPELSCHKITEYVSLGNHGVQNVLQRYDLNTYEKRLVYAERFKEAEAPAISLPRDIFSRLWEIFGEGTSKVLENLRKVKSKATTGALLGSLSVGLLYIFYKFLEMLRGAAGGSQLGLTLASISLFFGTIFFLYSSKYYGTLALILGFSRKMANGNGNGQGNHNSLNGNGHGIFYRLLGNGNGKNGNHPGRGNGILARLLGKNGHHGEDNGYILQKDLDKVALKDQPFVSIHLPFYNEKRVANRILTATTSLDYKNYEVIVVDDSTDETVQILEKWKRHPQVKIIHRKNREGFKGGALALALERMDPRTEFVMVFDADFIPYPDTIKLFLKYFNIVNGHLEDYRQSDIAAVQGYQWHVLNKSENWITRGVRTEYAGSYVVERSGLEIIGGLKQIAGSVYMIRADVLKNYGWGTSITEDFELTLRLYADGYRVVYTPYIQAPSECVSTLRRLVKQRMRWAEGHSHNIKRMFWKVFCSPKLHFSEKLEFLYLTPYYLQAAFLLVGSLAWFLSEAVFRVRLPFWTALWGWSLVFTNFFSLPLMNGAGVFLEEGERRDYLGILSFIALCYTLVPFQAYAAVKGFLEKKEGPWFRTPKTGKITDTFRRSHFYRWIGQLFPGSSTDKTLPSQNYLALATAHNTFDNFGIKRRKIPHLVRGIIVFLLIITINLAVFASRVPTASATNPTDLFYLRDEASNVITATVSWQLSETADTNFNQNTQYQIANKSGYAQYKPGQLNTTNPSAATPSTPTGEGWIWDTPFQDNGSIAAGTWTFYFNESDNQSLWVGHLEVFMWKVTVSGGSISGSTALYDSPSDGSWPQTDILDGAVNRISLTTGSLPSMSFSANEYLYVEYWLHITTKKTTTLTSTFRVGDDPGDTTADPRIDMPAITIPENIIILIAILPFIYWIIKRFKRRKEAVVIRPKEIL